MFRYRYGEAAFEHAGLQDKFDCKVPLIEFNFRFRGR
jgi:hypothetical protein